MRPECRRSWRDLNRRPEDQETRRSKSKKAKIKKTKNQKIRRSGESLQGGSILATLVGQAESKNCQLPDPLARKTTQNARRASCFSKGMTRSPDEVEEVTERIIGCGIEVHRTLGPGLLESVYRECLILEMKSNSLDFDSERSVPLQYKGTAIGSALRLDLLVEGCVVVELKAVEQIHPVHLAQVITYLKLTGYPAGLLLNFNATTLRGGLKRLDHPDLYAKRNS